MIKDDWKTNKDPRWGSHDRDKKAHMILQTLFHYIQPSTLQNSVCIDIGCGSGEIAFHIAKHVKSMIGIDPEPWLRWEKFQQLPNLQFHNESIENISCADSSADIIICNQVYEHIGNLSQLINEIYRILKPGGYCYFAGPNLLFPIEPHVGLPFIHWLPRKFALKLLKVCRSKAILDAYSVDYWRLQQHLNFFKIYDDFPYIITNPKRYNRTHWFWYTLSHIPQHVLHKLTWLSPGFVFVLHKI